MTWLLEVVLLHQLLQDPGLVHDVGHQALDVRQTDAQLMSLAIEAGQLLPGLV
jgi:hypothetical protein